MRVGKSRLARRLTTILPAVSLAEARETTRLHRVAGRTGARTAVVTTRPFRAPHHTISDVGLIGTGRCRRRARLPLAHYRPLPGRRMGVIVTAPAAQGDTVTRIGAFAVSGGYSAGGGYPDRCAVPAAGDGARLPQTRGAAASYAAAALGAGNVSTHCGDGLAACGGTRVVEPVIGSTPLIWFPASYEDMPKP